MAMRLNRIAPLLAVFLALPAALLAATPAFAADKAAKPKRVCSSTPAATGSRLPQRSCVTKAPAAERRGRDQATAQRTAPKPAPASTSKKAAASR